MAPAVAPGPVVSLPLPFGLLLFSRKTVIISSRGMAEGKVHHEPRTVAARVDSSDRECLILDTVSPPWENALSTSVEVATWKVRVHKH
jgi:hypothetical protein